MVRVIVIGVLCASVANAAPQDKPWEANTTKVQRDEAYAMFTKANPLLLSARYREALELYETALASFGHPRIHLGAARALVALGRPADAFAHIEAALQWGAAPFDATEHADAVDLKKRIANQVATVTVNCTTPGARVTLDGRELVECPGKATRVVEAGHHQIVGTKSGLLAFTEDVNAIAGQTTSHEIALRTIEFLATKERRWSVWTPWIVVAGGVGLAALGIPLQLAAASNMDEFRREVTEACGTVGCADDDPRFTSLEPTESRARLQNRLAISSWIVGGVVIASGLVMVFANRPRVVVTQSDVVVVPLLRADGVGVGLCGNF